MSHLRILHWLPRTLRRKSKLLHHIKTPALSGLSLLQNLILYNVLFYSFSPITSLLCQDFPDTRCLHVVSPLWSTLPTSACTCMYIQFIHAHNTCALCTWLDFAHFSWLNFSVTSSAKSFLISCSEYFIHL